MAAAPMSAVGCATVVRGGAECAAMAMSSKPTTDRSVGTRNPARFAACSTPRATASFAAKMALGTSSASMIMLSAATPSACVSWSTKISRALT
ncbi:hypothetical protein H9L22_01690 [Tessaracoccus defluvii]|uniref:Uncharacterized protein n=1 Tax=Tessaracoccus defluvii TaxID=1285901 RepID=A0A7H0H6R3_9ACTN|nr:hypothetical protein [Tessaracoccus defluvii]QNP56229.1 hypothetical protein H9L22_01690 [Tessaracoccus defluvii]